MNLLSPRREAVDPYRIFFPIGCAFAVWGASVWLGFARRLIPYPGAVHPDLMIGGFLLSFAIGFLLTAVPRFTGTNYVGYGEMLLVGWPLGLEAFSAAGVFGPFRQARIDHLAMACILLTLFAVLVPRYIWRRQDPPPTFPIAGLGVGAGAVGASLWAAADMGVPLGNGALVGRLLVLHGFMPALVLGIGGRLVPMLNGRFTTPPSPGQAKSELRIALTAAVLLIGGIILEALVAPNVGRLLQALAVTLVAARFWALYRLPQRRGVQSWAIWCSSWSFVLGFWGSVLVPAHSAGMLHLTFIGGLGLLTLAIATRVLLSHGGFDLGVEVTSRALLATAVLIGLATVVRVSAEAVPPLYLHALALAALFWLAGLAIWCARFLPAAWMTGKAELHGKLRPALSPSGRQ